LVIQFPRHWSRRARIGAAALTVAVAASVAVTVPLLAGRHKSTGTGRVLPQEPYDGSRVRVNQIGYLPTAPKRATLVTDATGPLPWQLRDGAGRTVASGTSSPHEVDPTSGERVHTIDFSGVTATGKGYKLTADGETSAGFPIGAEAYERLRADALSFYYTQRSGTPILDRVAPGYGRAAGHLGVAPNTGDVSVPCQPGTCDYRLDVRGGWYDAGDHGKYVVNGGIAVAQLMSLYERNRSKALGDGSLRVPEHGNKVPDVLDEARWELEFLLRMQVPADQKLAGMAHHKVGDVTWTGLPLDPAADPQQRVLSPPSTSATLNLAATAAQGARLFKQHDPAFADRLLKAARAAWTAAEANPSRFAPEGDGLGSGAYGDTDVSDERYWAAAELFLTTGDREFSSAVLASPWHTSDVFKPEGFDWQRTAALGRLSLATVPSGLSDRDRVRGSVVAGANRYLTTLESSGYGLAYAPAGNRFDWGSNGLVANILVVMATGADISGERRLRDGVLDGFGYLLGRNALDQSYVTGYGAKSSQNQHSRWYARQLDQKLPPPPPGTLAGGPNSSIQDPVAAQSLQGCKPQLCYVDDIKSWSTNELTINWNSALAWVAAFAADGDGPPSP
jgi:endoglucanase